MTKARFLLLLEDKLSGLPQADVEERLSFYSEMIEDRMEEGLSEEEAVAAVGAVDEIAAQIIADTPSTKEKTTSHRRLKGWEIVLLVLGGPLWFSLLVAAVAVVLSVYVSLWTVIISLWAVFASLLACGFGGGIAGIAFAVSGHGLTGIAVVAAGLICAGLAIFLFYGCKMATWGTVLLTKKAAASITHCLVKKERIK